MKANNESINKVPSNSKDKANDDSKLININDICKAEINYAITTVDNPYDPVEQYADWWMYDRALGYNTPVLLGRFLVTTEAQAEEDYWKDVDFAINEILSNEKLNHKDPFYLKLVYKNGKLINKINRDNLTAPGMKR